MNRKQGIKSKKSGKEINKQGQSDKMKEEIGRLESTEDVTKYGEFVSSYFAWLTLDKQKEKANQMEHITDKSLKKQN